MSRKCPATLLLHLLRTLRDRQNDLASPREADGSGSGSTSLGPRYPEPAALPSAGIHSSPIARPWAQTGSDGRDHIDRVPRFPDRRRNDRCNNCPTAARHSGRTRRMACEVAAGSWTQRVWSRRTARSVRKGPRRRRRRFSGRRGGVGGSA